MHDPAEATPAQIDQAAWSTVPNVPVLFWCFRVMVGLGLFFILLFAVAFYLSTRHRFEQQRWFLRVAVCSLPLPWIAAELGWIVAEYGRQPWAIDGVLPTFLGVSTRPAGNVIASLVGFVVFYSALAAVEVYPDGAHDPARTRRTGLLAAGPAPDPAASCGAASQEARCLTTKRCG